MNQNLIFAVVGGDLRQSCLAGLLAEEGYRVYALCMKKSAELSEKVITTENFELVLPGSNVVVFPLPISADSLILNAPFCEKPPLVSEVFRYIAPEAAVFGGMVSDRVHDMAQLSGFPVFDYYEREELIVRNCVPTAEGALAIAMQETAKTIFGSHCLVTGFGRVAKAMARLLIACGAQVTVSARKQSDLAWAAQSGAKAVPMKLLSQAAAECDIIFNTVPVKLFDEQALSALKRDCLLIDLASKPGGADVSIG